MAKIVYPGQTIIKVAGTIAGAVAGIALVMNLIQMAMYEAIITMITEGAQEALDMLAETGYTAAESIGYCRHDMILCGVAAAVSAYHLVLGILSFRYAERPDKARTLLILTAIGVIALLASVFFLVGGNYMDVIIGLAMLVLGYGAYKNMQPRRL